MYTFLIFTTSRTYTRRAASIARIAAASFASRRIDS